MEVEAPRDFAGHYQDKSKEDRFRYNLMEENTALKDEFEDSQFQEHLCCKWAAAEHKGRYLKAQLEEVCSKNKYSDTVAEAMIKDLKDQLERARSNETRSF